MKNADFEILSSDRFGLNVWTHPTAVAESPIRFELNGIGSFTFSLPANDEGFLSGRLDPIKREVQVWRNGVRVWWGVITNTEVHDLQTATVTCAGLLWYFTKRYVGKASRTNILGNGSFDTGALSPWFAVGVTADIVDQWGYLPSQTHQLNLYQAGTGDDTFVTQIVTVPGGTYWTLSGWFHIRMDSTWVGPAIDGRGLYLERLGTDGTTVEDKQYFAITNETPRGVFQRATVNMFSPPDRNSIFRVRLYATRCTNATPSGGRPPGSIIWDNIQLVAMESLSFPYPSRMGAIINALAVHAQNADFGKIEMNIDARCPDTDVVIDRTYQYVDHRQILDAITEFAELGLCDVGIEWHPTNTERWINCYAPHQGEVRTDYALELGSRTGIHSVPSIEKDGTKAVTAVIVQGEGSGPDREEAWYSDGADTDGVVLEEIFAPTDLNQPSFDLLPGIARARVERLRHIPNVPKLQLVHGTWGFVRLGDTLPVLIDSQRINANYRVVALELDPRDDSTSCEVNPA